MRERERKKITYISLVKLHSIKNVQTVEGRKISLETLREYRHTRAF